MPEAATRTTGRKMSCIPIQSDRSQPIRGIEKAGRRLISAILYPIACWGGGDPDSSLRLSMIRQQTRNYHELF
jgi:hypothetical protein